MIVDERGKLHSNIVLFTVWVITMYLEPWNTGYFLSEFQVERVREDRPCINEQTFLELQWELYPTGEQEDEIMLKVEDAHFAVEGSTNTPTGVLGIPHELIDELSVRNPPKRKPVLVVKPWFQEYLSWSKAT